MSEFFKEEDFDDEAGGYGPYAETLANLANKHIKNRGTIIYCGPSNTWSEYHWTNDGKSSVDTHRAVMINIEEIPKKKCKKHIPQFEQSISGGYWMITNNICGECGIKLKVRWDPE